MAKTKWHRPTGTVAFLFTDIEASTRRWEHYGDAMRPALRRHDEILRTEIEARRGYVFKTVGDAFCAAFSKVSDALEAAIEGQRRLGREDFRAVDGLAVRMAIGVGESDERDGDYFGAAVSRVARLLSVGRGGQILISGDAADLALPTLPYGITLRHLGSVPLRDVEAPERIYQPVGAGLRSDFKALRVLETPPNNLPRQATSFVGRHDDIARIESLLEEGPLVTIVGAGGIGKTRVALEIASTRLHDEPDGAWLVDLASIGDASLIAGTILSSLGGERSADGGALSDLVTYLEKRDLLLILDNSEHLVSEVAAIIAQIVARCPQVTVLATSRAPLDISGERLYRLSSLDPASAARLFADRARAANPALSLESKAPLVNEICERLDGIALAIELAAARVRTMSVDMLVSHLQLRLLTGGRDRRPRQQTMHALIDWSYELLAQEERRVLRRCAVFMRGFTLNAATEVCAGDDTDDWQILEVIGSLVDKSLVVAEMEEGEQRYRLLEPIREYGWEKLVEAGEVESTRRAHAVALAALAAQWYAEFDAGPRPDWLTRMERDLPNLRAALRWSIAESNASLLGATLVTDATILFLRLGLFAEGIEWGDRVLSADLSLPRQVEARLRYGLSMLHGPVSQSSSCLDQAEAAAELYRGAEDTRGLARALSQVAFRYALLGRDAETKSPAQEALRLARDSGDRRLLADVLRRCAASFTSDGFERVRSLFAESVEIFRALGRNDDTARALTWWGQWEEGNGDYARAIPHLLEASRIDDNDAATMFHAVEIASCYLAMGEPQQAEHFARKGLIAAAKRRYFIARSLAIAYLAAIKSDRDVRRSAKLLGYAQAHLRAQNWRFDETDAATMMRLRQRLQDELGDGEVVHLLALGAGLTDDEAAAYALSP